MAARKHGGLGRGIDALFSQGEPVETSAEAGAEEVQKKTSARKGKPAAKAGEAGKADAGGQEKAAEKEHKGASLVRLTKIEPNRNQPRTSFDQEKLDELADSIQKFGLIEPLIVRAVGSHYEIIAGERRWRAARQAGLKEVPVVLREDLSEKEVVELSLIENIQREQLNPIEEAKAFRRLIEEFHLTQEEAAARVSKSRAAVTNALRLLKLTNPVQAMLVNEKLTTGHARALIALEDSDLQYQAAQEVVRRNLNVRETEKLVRKLSRPEAGKKTASDPALDVIYHDYEEKLNCPWNKNHNTKPERQCRQD